MTAVLLAVAPITSAGAASPVLPAPTISDVGAAGVASPLAATSSQYTASGTGAYSGLQVTVNQTASLINQAVSVNWSGGTPTPVNFEGNYLQVMQCWSAPDATGPTPEQCEFGANPYNPTGVYLTTAAGGSENGAYTRQLGSESAPGGYDAPCGSGWWVPFEPVDGTVVEASGNGFDGGSCGQNFWQNPWFNNSTTNELDFAYTRPNGTGSELFTVDTSLEAPGLGCGAQSEAGPNGSSVTPKCWLVVIPQPATASATPLSPSLWQNRIVIPLSFLPVGSSCTLGAHEVPIEGGELAEPAISNWQPALCATPGSSPYSYSEVSDDQARSDLVAAGPARAGMAVVSRPINPATVSPSTPVDYAPVTLSGVVVAFNVQRQPYGGVGPVTAAEDQLANTRLAHINLTPRLVAKLLTQSYGGQLYRIFDNAANTPANGSYDWVINNPVTLFDDPDFEQYNPEFLPAVPDVPGLLQAENSVSSSGLVLEEPDSDAAYQLWQWVLSDRQAVAWLEGNPDPWGMRVNPNYSLNPALNPSGSAFGNPVPDNYPKSDPYCWQDTTDPPVGNPPEPPRALCAQDWLPYAGSMQNAAQETIAANDASHTTYSVGAANPDTVWVADGPEPYGSECVLSITDAASAAQYGLPTASLSPAGEDGTNPTFTSPAPTFVAPTPASILNGEQAMTPSATPSVLQPNSSSTTADAYPLPMLSYAAVTPATLTASAAEQYARFIDYAVGKGQVPGLDFGDLPTGYVPLPKPLVAEASATAEALTTSASHPSSTATTTPLPTATLQPTASGLTGVASATIGTGSASATGSTATGGPAGGATRAGVTASASPTTVPSAAVSQTALTPARTTNPTPGLYASAVRYTLLVLLVIGIGAGLTARWITLRRGRRAPHPTPAGDHPT